MQLTVNEHAQCMEFKKNRKLDEVLAELPQDSSSDFTPPSLSDDDLPTSVLPSDSSPVNSKPTRKAPQKTKTLKSKALKAVPVARKTLAQSKKHPASAPDEDKEENDQPVISKSMLSLYLRDFETSIEMDW